MIKGFDFFRNGKYNNQKTKVNNANFDSKLEARHYNDLLLLVKAKKITHLHRQVKIKLGKNEKCKIKYIADFVFFDLEAKEWVIMDSKGFVTDTFKLKKQWLLDNYSNFRMEVIYKDKKEILRPYSELGIDFEKYLENML